MGKTRALQVRARHGTCVTLSRDLVTVVPGQHKRPASKLETSLPPQRRHVGRHTSRVTGSTTTLDFFRSSHPSFFSPLHDSDYERCSGATPPSQAPVERKCHPMSGHRGGPAVITGIFVLFHPDLAEHEHHRLKILS